MKTIVLQDSDRIVLSALNQELTSAGYKVHTTYLLDQRVLELIANAEPHVVIIDQKIDFKDAIHICHLVKAFYPNLPVIASNCNTNIRKSFITKGFDYQLNKPSDLNLLYKLIRKFIPLVTNSKT